MKDLYEALNRAHELDEGTFSRVTNKIREATHDEAAFSDNMAGDNNINESYNEEIMPVVYYINDKYGKHRPSFTHESYTTVLVTFRNGVTMNPREPYDDDFFIEFQDDLMTKFNGEFRFNFRIEDTDTIMIDIEVL